MDNDISINPVTAIITVLLVVVCFVVPRKYVLVPMMLTACFLPADQRFMLGELNFQIIRVMVIALALRFCLRGELISLEWNAFDKVFLAWMVVGTVIYILQWATPAAAIYKSGQWLQVFGLYWVFRQTLRSWNDIGVVFVVLAICALLLTPFAVYETATGDNPFVALGRVQTVVREGEYRVQASFPHSIIFGLFWAVNIPLFIAFMKEGWCRMLFVLATAASVFMVFASSSSTPIGALFVGIFSLLAYKWRHYTRLAGWTLLAMLTALHLVMARPVWHLLSRIRVVGGSTGWHRFNLIDGAIRHFGEWAVLGTRSTAHWGHALHDVTNQYVFEGVLGGLATLVLFIVMLSRALKVFLAGSLSPAAGRYKLLHWCLFVTVVVHCVAFLGVSYFGQISILWYMLLAIAALFYESSYAAIADKAPSKQVRPQPVFSKVTG